ncbi:kinase-like protein [Aspergillus costaricaensis CBS 115574]|uniref:Kinase-like protein n=1 Tax=Aspergillus costaricaensis CBS 115574 TaxID=1448317 RepID=A0ACD1IU73_9EURO|nr:kinase-like protein [Aspergillus costaricaensis CBS 115574]RAK94172.1 kinase-like protein [Aspergillus costaricaensis CBS 115574]
MFRVLQTRSLACKQLPRPLRSLTTIHPLYSPKPTPPPQPITQPTYHPEDSVENLKGYTPGGYHPTSINDEFCHGRYKIIHKLGYGSYSTVWLARDRQKNQYVALKIVTADSSTEKSRLESRILRHLQTGDDSSHPGRKYIHSSLLDEFSFDGPNGHHMCLVSEVAGCSVAEAKENSPNLMFPLDVAKAIVAQVILGVDYMHSRGVGHGDLHTRNILFQPTDFDTLSTTDIYNRFGPPFQIPISRIDNHHHSIHPHAPTHAIIPMTMTQQLPTSNINIKISDFGTSYLFTNPPSPEALHTPTILLPPEAIFHDPITSAADIWTLGCTLYDILGDRPLFEPWSDSPDDVIWEMVSMLGGELPERWGQRSDFTRSLMKVVGTGGRSLDERLWQMGRGETSSTCEFQELEMDCLRRLLGGMLVYEPEGRMSAREVAESGVMVEWAGMVLGRG